MYVYKCLHLKKKIIKIGNLILYLRNEKKKTKLNPMPAERRK
jgi:hypothetical protein